MRFSLLFCKFDVDIISSKNEQNRPMQSRDIASNVKSKKKINLHFFGNLVTLWSDCVGRKKRRLFSLEFSNRFTQFIISSRVTLGGINVKGRQREQEEEG